MKVNVERARAEWERLTPEQREETLNWLNEAFEPLVTAIREVADWAVQVLEKLAT